MAPQDGQRLDRRATSDRHMLDHGITAAMVVMTSLGFVGFTGRESQPDRSAGRPRNGARPKGAVMGCWGGCRAPLRRGTLNALMAGSAGLVLLLTLVGPSLAQAATTTILPYEATGYKYLEVSSGNEPGGWQTTSFDDSSWGTGDAAFGSGGGCPLQPTVKSRWDVNTDMLLRKSIVVPARASSVTVHVAVDNNVKIYWNGTLVGSADHGGCPAYDDFSFSVPGNQVSTGSNLLAVEGIDLGAESFLDLSVSVSSSSSSSALSPNELRSPSEFCLVCYMGKLIAYFVNPVNAESGEFWHTFADLEIPGRGKSLDLTRTYSSGSAATDGPFGFGWSFPYGMLLSFPDSTRVVVNEEQGSQVTFTRQPGGSYEALPRVTATLAHNSDGTWTFVRRRRDTFTFDDGGKLTAEKDLNGYVTSLAYDAAGKLTTVRDPAGRKLILAYTSSGRHISSVSDPLGRVVRYSYDGAGNLIDVTDVNGGDAHFAYDSGHRMVSMRFPNQAPGVSGSTGAVVSNTYDSQGRVTSQTDQLGRKTTFAYSGDPFSSSGGGTAITDPKGNVTVQKYQSGELISETKGAGTPLAATWEFQYDPATLGMTKVTDPNGHAITATFDSQGNVLTTTDALGRKTANTYDSVNNLLTTTDPADVTTTMTYDARGNLLTRSRPLVGTAQAQTVTYTYGDSSHPGDVTAMTDADGNRSTYTYDAIGDRTSATDPLGNKTTSSYNTIGWLLTAVSARGSRTTYSYNDRSTGALDGFGDIRGITDPLGEVTVYAYDRDRNLTSVTDPNGNSTAYAYDAADEQTAVHRADGTALHTTYWPDGTIKDQVNGAGHITHYDYDPLARESAVTDPLGRTTKYEHDGAGNRTTITDRQGRVTTMSYDAANELTSISYSDGKTPNVSHITYDADGQRTGQTDGSGTWSWTWDSLHRLSDVTEGSSGTVSYQYNLRDEPKRITYPNAKTVARGYDDAGRLTSVADWLGNTTTFAYDADGNLTTETLPSPTRITDRFSYAADDSLSSIRDTRGQSHMFSARYKRDNDQQVTFDSSAHGRQHSYRYTPLNQLCYAASNSTKPCASPKPPSTKYSYSSADNLVRNGSTAQTFDAADQLTRTSGPSGTRSFTYDPEGDRTSIAHSGRTVTTYDYNQALELTTVASRASYTYNGDGLRMTKTLNGQAQSSAWDVIGAPPTVLTDGTNQYVYGPNGLALEQVSAHRVLWLHHDQLGSTRVLTNSQGATTARYSYTPYGSLTWEGGKTCRGILQRQSTGEKRDPRQRAGSDRARKVRRSHRRGCSNRGHHLPAPSTPLLFAGQYRDDESGLYYLRARYYDPATAQFLTVDPAAVVTQERYAYVAGNPTNRTDPSGLVPCANYPDRDSGDPNSPCNSGDPSSPCNNLATGLQTWGQCYVQKPAQQAYNNLQEAWAACNLISNLDACTKAAGFLLGKGIGKISKGAGTLWTWGTRAGSVVTNYGGRIVGACGSAVKWIGGAASASLRGIGGAASNIWNWATGAPSSSTGGGGAW
jgi:RHS repeat-associated protein